MEILLVMAFLKSLWLFMCRERSQYKYERHRVVVRIGDACTSICTYTYVVYTITILLILLLIALCSITRKFKMNCAIQNSE
jgi:hypothetical protein